MKSVLLIGLGRFGKHMAMKLNEQKHEVLAIDNNEGRVNDVLPYVTHAQIGDSTNEAFIESLGVRNFDLCVVAIGDDFQASLETTALLKDNGAPFVLARASREVHAKFLLRNGADDVIYPEKETAIRAAVTYSADNVFDYIELTPEYSIYEVSVPACWIGKSIIQLSVRSKYHISILAIKQEERLNPLPRPEYVFQNGDAVFVLGEEKDIQKFLQV